MPRFNLAEYCPLCERRLRDYGGFFIFISRRLNRRVGFYVCRKCWQQLIEADTERRDKLMESLDYNVRNSLSDRGV